MLSNMTTEDEHIDGSDDNKAEQSGTRIVTTEVSSSNIDQRKQLDDLISPSELKKIRTFFPFEQDIVGEVIEISTKQTDHGEMNTAKGTKHTIAELKDSEFFHTRSPPKTDQAVQTYRWVHLLANDMHWFEVDTPRDSQQCTYIYTDVLI